VADYSSLALRYQGSIHRAGRVYPVAVEPLCTELAGLIQVVDDAAPCGADLLALGKPHLMQLLNGRAGLHDGNILCWIRTDKDGIAAVPGSYFDMLSTCDAVRAEYQLAEDPAEDDQPVRNRVHAVSGDPLVSGLGRAAGIGVSVLLTVPGGRHPDRRKFLVGRRSQTVGTDPGLWHVAPSGMLEQDSQGRHLETTVSRELEEELGVMVSPAEVARRGEILGVAHDLLRLRPDVALRLDLTLDESRSLAVGDGEFVEFRGHEMAAQDISEFWATHPPSTLTPAAAGAVALLEARRMLRSTQSS